jgi:hypothetical protein
VTFITSINQSGMLSGGVALPDSKLRTERRLSSR